MGGHDGAVSRKGEADGFGKAVHGVGGEHAAAGSARRTGDFFHGRHQIIVHCGIGSHHHGIHQVVGFSAGDTGFHGSARNKNGRNVQPHSRHQHSRGDLVTVRNAHHGVHAMGITHVFHTVGDNIARGQRIEHSVVPHGNTVVNGDCVEFGGKKSLPLNERFDLLADGMKVGVPRNKLGEGIHHGNHRFSHLFLRHPVGAPQAASPRHPAPLRRRFTA